MKHVYVTKLLLSYFLYLFFPIIGMGQTYTSVQDGNWSSSSTWGGSAPGDDLENVTVNINHRVVKNSTVLIKSNATVNVNNILFITSGGLIVESSDCALNITQGLVLITNGNCLNKAGG